MWREKSWSAARRPSRGRGGNRRSIVKDAANRGGALRTTLARTNPNQGSSDTRPSLDASATLSSSCRGRLLSFATKPSWAPLSFATQIGSSLPACHVEARRYQRGPGRQVSSSFIHSAVKHLSTKVTHARAQGDAALVLCSASPRCQNCGPGRACVRPGLCDHRGCCFEFLVWLHGRVDADFDLRQMVGVSACLTKHCGPPLAHVF